MPFRILVTGSSGFVGSAVSVALTRAGHVVRRASRQPDNGADRATTEWVPLPDLQGQIDWDPIVAGVDVVVHLAAIAHRSEVDSEDYARANRLATASLARACQRHKIRRLVFMSSIGAQAGSAADHVVTETDEPSPVTAYDRAKLAAEDEIRSSGVPFTILRPVIVYGPGAKANIALMTRIAALPVPLPFGSFNNRRSLVSIDNLAQAVVFCVDNPATENQTFIVADREPITFAEMLSALRQAQDRSPGLVPVPPSVVRALIMVAGYPSLWDRIGRELVASSAKLQSMGWSPRVDTRAGLGTMVRNLEGGGRSN
jgi:nucleoside-diphosphate-sugar epimerase